MTVFLEEGYSSKPTIKERQSRDNTRRWGWDGTMKDITYGAEFAAVVLILRPKPDGALDRALNIIGGKRSCGE